MFDLKQQEFLKQIASVGVGTALLGKVQAAEEQTSPKNCNGNDVMEMFDERICMGVGVGYDLFGVIKKVKELGFQGMVTLVGGEKHSHSLGEFPTFNWYNLDKEEKRKIKQALKVFKNINLHQAWDERWKEWVDCAEYLEAKTLTIHASIARKVFFPQMCDYIQGKDILIGIENEGGKYNDYVELIKSIENPQIGATVDVGHCAWFEEIRKIQNLDERAEKLNEIILSLIEELGTKVYHFHLHNVRKFEEVDFSKIPYPYWRKGDFVDHRCVPEGLIDFPKIFSLLRKVNYQGLFDIELEEPEIEEKAKKSGKYITELLKENYTSREDNFQMNPKENLLRSRLINSV